jgi:hypothetical protein
MLIPLCRTVLVNENPHDRDLEKIEKLINVNEDRLRLEPTNTLIQKEQEAKLAVQYKFSKQIKYISSCVTQEMYGIYQKLFPGPLKADPKKIHGFNPLSSPREE